LTDPKPTGIIVGMLTAGCGEAWNRCYGTASETSSRPDERMTKYYYGDVKKPFLGSFLGRVALASIFQPSPIFSAETRGREKYAVPCGP
jgi:hypothetical protein